MTEIAPDTHIAIVGGGISGVVVALGLMERNVPFGIYESMPGFNEIGAGISFGPNALMAMQLLSPTLFDIFKEQAVVNPGPCTEDICFSIRSGTNEHSSAGKLLFDITSDTELTQRTGMPARCCVQRARFLREMTKRLPDNAISYGKQLLAIRNLDAGYPELSFSDGTSILATAVIGCDGIHSRTRQLLHGTAAEPAFAGEYVYRAVVPQHSIQSALKDAMGDTRSCQLYVSRGGYILTYPIGHDLVNIVAARVQGSRTWDYASWSAPSSGEDVFRDFNFWHAPVIKLLADGALPWKWALSDNCHDRPYCKNLVCLLGDAAHNMTPHLGAGAGMAMEDAYVLSCLLGDCLDETNTNKALFTKALLAYDYVRRPRSQRIVKLSRRIGKMFMGAHSELEAGQKAVTDAFREVWEYDVQQALCEARAMMVTEEAETNNENI